MAAIAYPDIIPAPKALLHDHLDGGLRPATIVELAAAVLTDLWRPLPLADGVADVVLNVFAPRNGAEFRRVLRPEGVLLVVTPGPDHLRELIDEHGLIHVDPDKAARVEEALGGHFRAGEAVALSRELELTAGEARTLIGMTPSARHVPAVEAAPGRVTASVVLTTYRPLGQAPVDNSSRRLDTA